MDAWVAIVLAVLALTGPALGYLISVRKASGRIQSSEASDLWKEAGDLRREYSQRIHELDVENKALKERNVKLQDELWAAQRREFGDGHA